MQKKNLIFYITLFILVTCSIVALIILSLNKPNTVRIGSNYIKYPETMIPNIQKKKDVIIYGFYDKNQEPYEAIVYSEDLKNDSEENFKKNIDTLFVRLADGNPVPIDHNLVIPYDKIYMEAFEFEDGAMVFIGSKDGNEVYGLSVSASDDMEGAESVVRDLILKVAGEKEGNEITDVIMKHLLSWHGKGIHGE